MIKIVNATEAKNRFGAIIQQAYLKGQHLVVKRDDIPVVAIVPMSDYEWLTHKKKNTKKSSFISKEEKARRKLINFLDKVHSKIPEISEKEADLEIKSAIKEIRFSK